MRTPRRHDLLRPSRLARAFAAILAIPAVAGCTTTSRAPAPVEAAVRPAPAVRPAETFDAAWTIVRDQHFDRDLNGVDWDAVRVELEPRAASAATQGELRGVLGEMLARLGQSHFAIIPGDEPGDEPGDDATPAPSATDDSAGMPARASTPTATPTAAATATAAGAGTRPSEAGPGLGGVDVAFVEGRAVVLRVRPDGPGARAGVEPGWTLLSAGGTEVDEVLGRLARALEAETDGESPHARQLRAGLASIGAEVLSGPAGGALDARFLDRTGAVREVVLELEPPALGVTQFGNLPAFPIEVETSELEIPAEGGRPVRVGVIAFNVWMTGASDAIDRAVDRFRGMDGIVLDLRGNPGGVGAMSMGVAGHFVREKSSLGSMIGRDSTLEFNALPRRVSAEGKRVRPFSRPLAIVQDGRSASTSEVFAGGLQDLGRARVFGEPSAGMALPANAVRLPNGDVLLHAIADFVTSTGTRLEARGVLPDETVPPTIDALRAGRDPALDAAAAWIARETLEARARRAASGG
ncbi:MAG: hypothetical protein RIS86_1840 [Planctomycetota bacterium]